MIPMRMLEKLFPNEDEFVLPEYRAQRKLNESRIPVISQYIIENRDSYVFSALAASIDGNFKFVSSMDSSDIGILEVSMDARFLINDGQHRKAAILDAINEEPDLGNETISVVLYEDSGLSRSQQIFTDLNKHAVKTSNSIAELYDSRDDIAVITRNVVSKVLFCLFVINNKISFYTVQVLWKNINNTHFKYVCNIIYSIFNLYLMKRNIFSCETKN